MSFCPSQVPGGRICHYIPSIWCETSLASGRNGTYHDYPIRPPSLLADHSHFGAIEPIPGQDDQSVQDCVAGCDALFPGHLHIAFYIRNDSVVREGEDVVVFPAASQVTETILAFDPTAPWHVSYIGIHSPGLFTRPFSTRQRKHRVRLNVFLLASPSDLNRVLGICQ